MGDTDIQQSQKCFLQLCTIVRTPNRSHSSIKCKNCDNHGSESNSNPHAPVTLLSFSLVVISVANCETGHIWWGFKYDASDGLDWYLLHVQRFSFSLNRVEAPKANTFHPKPSKRLSQQAPPLSFPPSILVLSRP